MHTWIRPQRRGSIYIAVLGAAMLVSLIGVSSLMVLRLRAKSAEMGRDFIEARLYARTAIDIGMGWIRTDPNWRTSRGNGSWASNRAIGSGFFSLDAMDPIDNDITNGSNHPVILTGTGKKNQAVYKVQVRLEVGPLAGSCLEVSMQSGGHIGVSSAILSSDQTISANHNVVGGGNSTISANVEALNAINGGTYTKATKLMLQARRLPDSAHVLDYYRANGTQIPLSSLLVGNQQLLTNTSFEVDPSGWYLYSGGAPTTIGRDGSQALSGGFSLKVSGRINTTDVAAQDLPLSSLMSGRTYSLDLPIYSAGFGSAQATLVVQSTGSGTQSFSTPATSFNAGQWKHTTGTVTPTWSGTLIKATAMLTVNNRADYYMDAVTLTDTSYNSNSYVIDRVLLSPACNPFGPANAQGIYIIDCATKDLTIANARIVGTLVLLNAGTGSCVQGPVAWESAQATYPALLSDRGINIACDGTALSEAAVNVNFNPSGTPYPYLGGGSNATLGDTYPSRISGIIYSAGDTKFTNSPAVYGVVVAGGDITVSATRLDLQYNSAAFYNPPPGFDLGQIGLRSVPGSWRRVAP